jgi:hypothetical protein
MRSGDPETIEASALDELLVRASVGLLLARPGSAPLDDDDNETAALAVVLLSRAVFDAMPRVRRRGPPALLTCEIEGEIRIAWEGGGRPIALDKLVAQCAGASGASGALGRRMIAALPGAVHAGRFALPGFELAGTVTGGSVWKVKPKGV